MKLSLQPVLLLLSIAALAHVASAHSKHHQSKLVVLGDSLSDTGNFLALTNNTYPDPAWYIGGRSSGGKVWPEFLSKYLKMKMENYAFYGASACPVPDGIDVTGLTTSPDATDQLKMYLATKPHHKVKNNLHALFLGGGDYASYIVRVGLGLVDPTKTPPPNPKNVVDCIMSIAVTLLEKGATKLIFSNLPDLAILPSVPVEQRAMLSQLTTGHAQYLSSAVAHLTTQYPDATFILVDARDLVTKMYTKPWKYGFINVTASALILNTPLPKYPFVGASGLNKDANRYMWFDNIHPTSRVHMFLAEHIRLLVKTRILDRESL